MIVIKADKFVMSEAGIGTFCLDPPESFTRSRNWSRQNLPRSASLFSRSLQDRDGWKAFNDGCPLADLIKLKNREYRNQSSHERKMPEFR